MCNIKVLSILFLLCFVLSSAEESEENSSLEEYEHPDEITIRMFPRIFSRGKSDGTAPSASRPAIRQYWQNIMSNMPSFRWNMTNPLGNLFNGGIQSTIETPVNYEDSKPKRRRKSSKIRKSTVKKNKSRRRSHDQYQSYSHANAYGHLQLQPLGMDEQNVMHFYEPRSGQYYALHLVSSPNYYEQQQQQQYYNPHQSGHEAESSYDDNSHYNKEDQENEEHSSQENSDSSEDSEDTDEDDTYDHLSSPDRGYHYQEPYEHNEHHKYAEAATESDNDYSDDIQVIDNWGYSDADIFGDRKMKLSLTPISLRPQANEEEPPQGKGLKSSIMKLKRNQLKPETKEEVMFYLANKQRMKERRHKASMKAVENDEEYAKSIKRLKPSFSKKSNEDIETESMRNVLGSYMKDDALNRNRQRSTTKSVKRQRLVEQPRQSHRHRFYPRFW